MKQLQNLWLNIKIHIIWRIAFLIGLVKNHISEKLISYNENRD